MHTFQPIDMLPPVIIGGRGRPVGAETKALMEAIDKNVAVVFSGLTEAARMRLQSKFHRYAERRGYALHQRKTAADCYAFYVTKRADVS
jgi:hypothetical protein